nr:immunoglobulin heavy chain junction region [Macaca mulatta]MOV88217.1 immunoglobulin heavy chain junction region [Macaca mulatta]MOV89365.1 immunoglobulin heavy chain junction region [Macaca mulatta]MOV90168.1 immunoglobulin heavy chain junction region [Macaca mulatta]MOV91864.1 immunoglobulin heavy chain junction region [Macaca mulatta]
CARARGHFLLYADYW